MHDELDELLPLYALGVLEGRELEELEAHLAGGCERCARELAAVVQTAAELAFAAPLAAPPPDLRERVLASVSERDEPRDREPIPFRRRPAPSQGPTLLGGTGILATAASLVAAAVFAIVYMGWALADATRKLDEQVRQVSTMRVTIVEQDKELEEKEAQLGIINDPEVRLTSLTESEPPKPGVDVLWHPGLKRGLLVARGLEPVAQDKTYELWLIAGGAPVPAATFDVDENGNAVVSLSELSGAAKPELFAITVEKAGGSDKPTTPIRYKGEYPKS
jgi:anti-sigma-K factor RskA